MKYLMIEKASNKILSYLEIDGEYLYSDSFKYSRKVSSDIVLDFTNYEYTYDDVSNKIYKQLKNKEEDLPNIVEEK